MTNDTTPVADDWYLTFFDELPTAFWRAAVTPEMTAGEVRWLRSIFADASGPLLDVPCGDGRHARALAALGHEIVGIDLSEHQLAEARSVSSGPSIEWLRQDMSALELHGRRFAGAYCFGNSFGYLTDRGTHAFLAAIGAALDRGACFALDTGIVAEALLPKLRPEIDGVLAGIEFSARRSYDPITSYLSVRWRFTRNGETVERVARYAVRTISALATMLGRHGLEIERMEGDLEGAAFTPDSARMLLVARRRS